MPVQEKHEPEKREPVQSDNRFEGFKTPGPKEGELPKHAVFEGFTTPSPVPQEVVPLEAWNEPAYIQTLIDEGFQHAADEGFRFHVYRFGGGGAAGMSRGGKAALEHKREEPKHEVLKHEDPKHKDENHRKGH